MLIFFGFFISIIRLIEYIKFVVKMDKKIIFVLLFVMTILIIATALSKSIEDKNWLYPGFSQYSNNFYHKQYQISAKNAANLEIKWAWEIPRRSPPVMDKEGNPVRGSWTPPLVIDGIVYTATFDNQFFALDAKDGNAICKSEVPRVKINNRSQYSGRGVTYYDNGILISAADCTIYAFDIKDCSIKWIFPNTCENIPGNLGSYINMNPPVIYGDYFIVENGGGEFGARGFIAAYNLTTKKLLWRWFTIPPATNGPKNWHLEAHKGNIKPYKYDWGNSTEFGGGTIWAWPAIDTENNVIFFGTGNPSPDLNGATRPGPNLYTDSVVALNITNGKMLWYYQHTSHDVYDHDIGFSVIYDKISVDGKKEDVVIAGSKSGHVIVLRASDGKLLYAPVPVSLQLNNINDNNPKADLTLESAGNDVICQSANGGIQSSIGLADNVIYAVSQNQCQKMEAFAVTSRDKYFGGRTIGVGQKENSTLYAIDAVTGRILWTFFMNDSYRKGSATISGDLVLLGADNGFAYILDRNNGNLLFQLDVGAPIGAPITVGAGADGKMRIFVPFGSRGLRERENGIIALGLKENKFGNTYAILGIVLAILIIGFVVYKNRIKSAKPKGKAKGKSQTKKF